MMINSFRKVASIAVASLAVAAVFSSCSKEETATPAKVCQMDTVSVPGQPNFVTFNAQGLITRFDRGGGTVWTASRGKTRAGVDTMVVNYGRDNAIDYVYYKAGLPDSIFSVAVSGNTARLAFTKISYSAGKVSGFLRRLSNATFNPQTGQVTSVTPPMLDSRAAFVYSGNTITLNGDAYVNNNWITGAQTITFTMDASRANPKNFHPVNMRLIAKVVGFDVIGFLPELSPNERLINSAVFAQLGTANQTYNFTYTFDSNNNVRTATGFNITYTMGYVCK